MKINIKKYIYKPIQITIIWSLLTIFMFEFGVINYSTGDKFLLYFFLICAQLAICLGYWFGMHSPLELKGERYVNGHAYLLKIFKCWFMIYIITFLPAFFIETRTYSLNISNLINNIVKGLSDSSILYNGVREAENVSGIWRIINWGIVLTGFVRWTFFPLGIYLWEELKRYQKVFYVVFAFFFLAAYITTGTSAGIFTISIVIGLPVLMKFYRCRYVAALSNNTKKRSRKKKLFIVILVTGMVFASLWLFSNNMKSREVSLYSGNGDFSSFPWNIMPEPIRPAIYWLTAYGTQGYKALSYCIELPFTPTFGLGSSWFTIQNFSSLLHIDILKYTYLGKAEALGFGAYRNWHTVYTWIANDFSFIGTPVVLFFLFYLMAQSWRDYLNRKDPFAFCFMTIMGLFVLYLSANNTVFSHSDTLFTFWIILYLWKHNRSRCYYDEQYFEFDNVKRG